MKRGPSYAAILILTTAAGSFGATLGLQTAGGSTDSGGYYGFGFTTPNGGPWKGILVNFFSDSASTAPFAQGDLFLFGSVYAGTPAGLTASGFLSESTGTLAGQWIFH